MTLVEPLQRAREQRAQPAPFQRRVSDLPPGNSFKRLLATRVIASVSDESASSVVARHWPHDRFIAELVERAASAPAMTSVTGWAAELAQRFVVDTLEALGPVSAAALLARAALTVTFDRHGTLVVPTLVTDANQASFVAENEPIPVRQLATSGPTLEPFQLATIAVLTREMIESSNAEALISDVLTRAIGLALDTVMFDANAATAARPAGLRNGITTTTPSANADLWGAFVEDVSVLVSATGTVGGMGPYILIANVGRVAGMATRFIGEAKFITTLPSSAAGNLLIAIAAPALVVAIGANPIIETGNAASLHMDTAPVAVGPVGATPHRSLFQTDSIAVKVRWPVSWALRDARGVAWTTPTWK